TTVFVWDANKFQRAISAKKLQASELLANWELLAGDVAAKGFEAILALTASPSDTIPFFEQRLETVPPVETQRLEKLVGQLSNAGFKTREAANAELLRLGERTILALEKALAAHPSLEMRRR